mmetsp:Transcript_6566/g.17614  ORF Transcript_6566/g.17614 Transcript_6566/m.17614 type:complete len:552 (-) Transcript_6566:1858-3513(-)
MQNEDDNAAPWAQLDSLTYASGGENEFSNIMDDSINLSISPVALDPEAPEKPFYEKALDEKNFDVPAAPSEQQSALPDSFTPASEAAPQLASEATLAHLAGVADEVMDFNPSHTQSLSGNVSSRAGVGAGMPGFPLPRENLSKSAKRSPVFNSARLSEQKTITKARSRRASKSSSGAPSVDVANTTRRQMSPPEAALNVTKDCASASASLLSAQLLTDGDTRTGAQHDSNGLSRFAEALAGSHAAEPHSTSNTTRSTAPATQRPCANVTLGQKAQSSPKLKGERQATGNTKKRAKRSNLSGIRNVSNLGERSDSASALANDVSRENTEHSSGEAHPGPSVQGASDTNASDLQSMLARLQVSVDALDDSVRTRLRNALLSLAQKANVPSSTSGSEDGTGGGSSGPSANGSSSGAEEARGATDPKELSNRAAEYLVLRLLFLSPSISVGSSGREPQLLAAASNAESSGDTVSHFQDAHTPPSDAKLIDVLKPDFSADRGKVMPDLSDPDCAATETVVGDGALNRADVDFFSDVLLTAPDAADQDASLDEDKLE